MNNPYTPLNLIPNPIAEVENFIQGYLKFNNLGDNIVRQIGRTEYKGTIFLLFKHQKFHMFDVDFYVWGRATLTKFGKKTYFDLDLDEDGIKNFRNKDKRIFQKILNELEIKLRQGEAGQPVMPDIDAGVFEWLDYRHAMKKAGHRVTYKELAQQGSFTEGYYKQAARQWKLERKNN